MARRRPQSDAPSEPNGLIAPRLASASRGVLPPVTHTPSVTGSVVEVASMVVGDVSPTGAVDVVVGASMGPVVGCVPMVVVVVTLGHPWLPLGST